MIRRHRAFLDELVAKVRSVSLSPPSQVHADLDLVRKHLITPWQSIVERLRNAVDAEFATLTPDETARLRVLETAPSLLGPLGLARDEVTHSRLLAWFLSQPDAVGEACRKSLLACLGLDVTSAGWQVARERDLGAHGRLDVHIEVPRVALIYVEVKIDAQERANQLRDYHAHLDTHAHPHKRLVFLTLDGRQSTDDVPHQALTFTTLVAAWLPHATATHPTSAYLAAWLVTLAADVLDAADAGEATSWSLGRRRRCLHLLRPSWSPRG